MARKVAEIDWIDKQIGAKIQELRLASGLSRQQLGDLIAVTHQQLQKYEKGTNRVSAGRLAVIARHLNKPVSYFYEEIGIVTSNDNNPAREEIDFSQNQRMCIEISRNFMKIKNSQHKDAISSLVKTLASNLNEVTKEGESTIGE
jgi:transcriptional regulator with XRE-family HTH domain